MTDTNRSPLAERFSNRRTARTLTREKNRIKTSIFIDGEVLRRADRAWKDYNHRHYPHEVMKAVFLEELLEQGLRDLDAVEAAVRGNRREPDAQTTPPAPAVPVEQPVPETLVASDAPGVPVEQSTRKTRASHNAP